MNKKEEEKQEHTRDLAAEHLGLVTCLNAKIGQLVYRGRDWRRSGVQEEYDVGTLIGIVLSNGERVGTATDQQLKAYKSMTRLCVVRWATNLVLVSSIGYNGVFELSSLCSASIAAAGMIQYKCALGASANAYSREKNEDGISVSPPCRRWCDCKNSWLTSRDQFYKALQSLGWPMHEKELWFTKKDGTEHYRPQSLDTKRSVRTMVGFADCGNNSLAYFRLVGSAWVENKITLARLVGCGDLMPKTYVIRRDNNNTVVERVTNYSNTSSSDNNNTGSGSSANIGMSDAHQKWFQSELFAPSQDLFQRYRTCVQTMHALEMGTGKPNDKQGYVENKHSSDNDREAGCLWFLKDASRNFGKGISLHTSLHEAFTTAGVLRPEQLFFRSLDAAEAEAEAEEKHAHMMGLLESDEAFATTPDLTTIDLLRRTIADQGVEYVLQAHVPRPLLFEGGRKVHARVFVFAHSPILSTRTRYYIARTGWLDVSPHKWSMQSTDSSTQQTHTRTMPFQEWWLYPVLFPRTCELLREVVQRIHPKLSEVIVLDRSSFELYGVDVMFDRSLRPWLLEFNSGPVLKEPYLHLLRGLLQITIPWGGFSAHGGGSGNGSGGSGGGGFCVDRDLAEKVGLSMRIVKAESSDNTSSNNGKNHSHEQYAYAAATLPPPQPLQHQKQTAHKDASGSAAVAEDMKEASDSTNEDKSRTGIPESNLWVCVADLPAPEPVTYASDRVNGPLKFSAEKLKSNSGSVVLTYNDHLSVLYGANANEKTAADSNI